MNSASDVHNVVKKVKSLIRQGDSWLGSCFCVFQNARMVWFLYMIECEDGSIYTGITVDLPRRYQAHVSGKGARYTRSHPPKRLLASVEYPDKSAALKAEHEMKRLSAVEKRAFCRQHGVSVRKSV